MKYVFIILAMAALLIGGPLVHPGPARADETYDQVMVLKDKIVETQNQGVLGIMNFAMCHRVISFGNYVERKNAKIDKGSRILFYYEPINWFTRKADGWYEFHLTQDIALENMEGEIMFQKEKVLTFKYRTRRPLLDLYATNHFSLGNTPVGKYIFKAILHDELKKNVATKSFEIEVVK